jgi:hypothetical protein
MPPARMQSAWFVYLLKSPDAPEGLADGDEDEPLDDPPVAPGGVVVPLPEPPVVPEGLVGPVEGLVGPVPEGLLAPGADELLPLPVCAAARAGTRATSATRSINISFCISLPPVVGITVRSVLRLACHRSKIRALVTPPWLNSWSGASAVSLTAAASSNNAPCAAIRRAR